MVKPEQCQMQVEHCEECKEWMPIPFHEDGGVCLTRGKVPMRRLSPPNSLDRTTKLPPRGMKVATGAG